MDDRPDDDDFDAERADMEAHYNGGDPFVEAGDDAPLPNAPNANGTSPASNTSPASEAPKASDTAPEKPKGNESKVKAPVDDSHSKDPDVTTDGASVAASAKAKAEKPKDKGFVLLRGDAPELANLLIKKIVKWYGGHPVYAEGRLWVYCPEKRRASDRVGAWVCIPVERLRSIVGSYAHTCQVMTDDGPKPLRLSNSQIKGVVEHALDLCAAPLFFAGKRYVHHDKGDALFRGWDEAGDEEPAGGCLFSDCYVRATAGKLEVLPHSPEHKARMGYDFPLEGDAIPFKFLEWLNDNFDGRVDRAEIIECIQEFFSAVILGMAPRFHKWLVLFGTGNNGKSVLVLTLVMLMPYGTTSHIPPHRLDKEHNLAQLAGKRLNSLEEMPENEIVNSEQIKAVVTGGIVTASRKYGQPFDFRSTVGFVIAANKLPPVRDDTTGFWRRPLVIEMTKEYPDDIVVRDYEERFRDEIPMLVRWALDGYRRLVKRQAYTMPASSQGAVDDWRKDTDPLRQWIEEEDLFPGDMKRGPGYDVVTHSAEFLYERFKAWCLRNGHRNTANMALNKFSAKLKGISAGWKNAWSRETDIMTKRKIAWYTYSRPDSFHDDPRVVN